MDLSNNNIDQKEPISHENTNNNSIRSSHSKSTKHSYDFAADKLLDPATN